MKKISRNRRYPHLTSYLITSLLLLPLSVSISAEIGDEEHSARKSKTLQITGIPPLFSIQDCQGSECKNIEPPKELLNFINEGYANITTEDITLDGYPEVILTNPIEGSVNTCSEIYLYDRSKNTLRHASGLQHQICNYSIKNDRLISSYRSGAKWHEDVYRIAGNNFILELTDSCIGCDHVNRTIYLPGNKTDELIITDDIDYLLRKPISTKIISDRATLYKEPDSSKKTNMYLIKSDKISLLDFKTTENNNNHWYKIKYITSKGKEIKAWVVCADIEYCK